MDITVWMSSANDEVQAEGEQVARDAPDGPERPSVAAWALVYPTGWAGERRQPVVLFPARSRNWPYAAGDNSRRRVSLLTHEYAGTLWSNVGPNISRSAGPHNSWRLRGRTTGSGGTALDLLSCTEPLLGYPRGHTPFSDY
ncbi:hypothetical protein EVAR_96477_1 [Eumeta japonica]|uniref:Uncharacterized protein n=1 Tax=Eumeta variegata TaxID=151549 RepID=A0A4C1VXL0_EUMVA|nr:hypothetical protein EVAR_96477_1 [Eumeta japonica]